MSLLLIFMLLPLLILFALLMRLEGILFPSAKGPLLYREIRVSQGKPFTFYKLRTFRTRALSHKNGNGVIHTKVLEQDFRNLTLTGMMLVQIYLDEIPQLFLVFTGHMTLVGPRPTNAENYARYVQEGGQAKQLLKAGLTGRFQTHKAKKYGLNQEAVDMEYARLIASRRQLAILLHDIRTLLQTVWTVIRAEGI